MAFIHIMLFKSQFFSISSFSFRVGAGEGRGRRPFSFLSVLLGMQTVTQRVLVQYHYHSVTTKHLSINDGFICTHMCEHMVLYSIRTAIIYELRLLPCRANFAASCNIIFRTHNPPLKISFRMFYSSKVRSLILISSFLFSSTLSHI